MGNINDQNTQKQVPVNVCFSIMCHITLPHSHHTLSHSCELHHRRRVKTRFYF